MLPSSGVLQFLPPQQSYASTDIRASRKAQTWFMLAILGGVSTDKQNFRSSLLYSSRDISMRYPLPCVEA